MKNFKRVALIFFVAIVVLSLTKVVSSLKTIKYNDLENLNEPKKVLDVSYNLLKILSKKDRELIKFDNLDLKKSNMKLYKLDQFVKDKKGVVLYLKVSDTESYLIGYRKILNKVVPLGVVDSFYKITDIDILPLKKRKTNLIIVRESIDEKNTTYEKGTFIRVYNYNKNFNIVLSLIENYEFYNNQMWDGVTNNSRWEMFSKKTDILWENEYYPKVNTLEYQSYFVSKEVNSEQLPKNVDFDITKIKEVKTEYIWSNKYNHFIIGEGVTKNSRKDVAIIEDLTYSLFNLKDKIKAEEKYRIKYKNGTIEVVDKSFIEVGKNKPILKSIKQ